MAILLLVVVAARNAMSRCWRASSVQDSVLARVRLHAATRALHPEVEPR